MDRESIEFLVRNLSHEIKNPLTTIKGYLQLSMMKKSDSDFSEKSVPIMISQVERIEKILDMMYPVFLKKRGTTARCGVRDLFEDILRTFPEEVRSRVRLNVGDGDIDTDRNLFGSIIDNLVSKFSWKDFPSALCEISMNSSSSGRRIEISFSGPDFPLYDNIQYFMPYANKTYYPSGTSLFEALWMADLLGIRLSNGGHSGVFLMDLP
jgi:light-regulated signal transduction histidine kinase (bacteriophytochrome)